MTTNPDDRRKAADLVRAAMELHGLTIADLEATAPVGGVTVAEFIDSAVVDATSKRSLESWGTSLRLMKHGLPDLCACFCDECLAVFRGDSTWKPCPCVTAGRCSCRKTDLQRGEIRADSCLDHCPVLGDSPLADIGLSKWTGQARWARLRAQKRAAVRNRNRATRGRATNTHTGASAVEHYRDALSKLYKFALGDQVPGVHRNIALELDVPARPAPVARAYDQGQLEELWDAIFTTGSRDPELDMLIVSFLLETGSRRSGPVKLRIADLLTSRTKVRLSEKNDKVDEQPISARLLELLLAHALERGDVVVGDVDPAKVTLADVVSRRVRLKSTAPVFHYKPRIVDGVLTPRPLTTRRFDSLWNRLKNELPWLDEIHGRPHDLRKTSGTFIERAHGHAVAQRWLRHGIHDTTGIYTAATADEVDAAHQSLIGQ